MAKISALLDQIDSGTLLLPEFQRGYVWNRDQVRGLMRSLYLHYPIGGLLLWETNAGAAALRGSEAEGMRSLLLDGQQRVTTLYGIIRGYPPTFFDGDPDIFRGLHFHVENQRFQFYSRNRMRDDDRWIDVTRLFTEGIGSFVAPLSAYAENQEYFNRLYRLGTILDRELHEEKITGEDHSIDVVVDIFNQVNSGGTQLSKGDLALAKLCSQAPRARQTMHDHLNRWEREGLRFRFDWLLRNVTAVSTGKAPFDALDDVDVEDFEDALASTAQYIDHFLTTLSSRLGIDHDQVLLGRGGIPVVSRLLHLEGGRFPSDEYRDKVLFWYIHTALRGRFTGSTETMLARDYGIAASEGIDGLIAELERWRGGRLTVHPDDFDGASRGTRFYPMLYLLARTRGARDLVTGAGVNDATEDAGVAPEVHPIFPKDQLRAFGYHQREVNAIANFSFAVRDTASALGSWKPTDYLGAMERQRPGVLESQWIPQDRELWELDRYRDFLAERRKLLAAEASALLEELRSGAALDTLPPLRPLRREQDSSPVDPTDARAVQIRDMVQRVVELGFAKPQLDSDIADPENGQQLVAAEAYWPEGLQPGLGRPVVLELDPHEAHLARMEELGYQVFTSVDALLGYCARLTDAQAGEQESEEQPTHADTSSDPPDGPDEVVRGFEQAMAGLYERCRREANYTPTQFRGMLAEYGAVATARRLLHQTTVSEGFAALWERGHLELTVEALVLESPYASLFTDEEVDIARRRLAQFDHAAG